MSQEKPNLFSQAPDLDAGPLPHRLRPTDFSQLLIPEKNRALLEQKLKLTQNGKLGSLVLWGPPGSGKTTFARILGNAGPYEFKMLSAVESGTKEIRAVTEQAKRDAQFFQKRTLLFIDEIHRFSKTQQDALLPHVEDGTLTLIGATTENPSFHVIPALLSRSQVVVFSPLEADQLAHILEQGLAKLAGDLKIQIELEPELKATLIQYVQGDARALLSSLEELINLTQAGKKNLKLTLSEHGNLIQAAALKYERTGEDHYNLISAFIKSMRASDPDAALYYLARMLEAGDDPLFLARRLVIFASEDVGNADPRAVTLAVSCFQSLDFVGMPEGWIPLAQATTYLACAPKSKAAYYAYGEAVADVREHGTLPVPLHIRNAPTKLMKNLNYGKDYKNPHQEKEASWEQDYLPEKIKERRYYKPVDVGTEKFFKEFLERRKKSIPD